jgi:hypothetical protein
MAKRLSCLCFGAIQSSVISITNNLFDIASAPDPQQLLDIMRDEVLNEAEAAHDALWERDMMRRLSHVDSALKESIRCNGFLARGIIKSVHAKEGIDLPDGTHIPYGVKVGVQAWSIHHDEDVYEDASKYDAFRHVKAADRRDVMTSDSASSAASSSGSDSDSDSGSSLDAAHLRRRRVGASADGQEKKSGDNLLVKTSSKFLGFSHGKQSWYVFPSNLLFKLFSQTLGDADRLSHSPGRFFAANQLKLILAHIAMLYEIEPIAERPVNKWFVGSIAPPMWETLRVRRRKDGLNIASMEP